MLTKQLRSRTSAPARTPKVTWRLARAFKTHAAPRRAASSLALSLALLSQMLIIGGAPAARAAAQAQPNFEVDEQATAQVVRLAAQQSGAATVNFGALSDAPSGGGEVVTAYASKEGAAKLVEPPPAPPEPTGTEADAVSKSARRGKPLAKSSLAAADKSSTVAAPSAAPDIATLPEPPPDFPAQSDNGLVAPPDTNGAVGPERVLSTLRSNYVVQDKMSGEVLSSVPIEVFWAPTGATTPYNPRALYDPYHDRWLLSAVSDPRSPNSSILVGVSQTGDPAGAYYLFRFDADSADQLWADFGSLGFNKNWAVVSFNAHNIAGDAFNQGRVLALDYGALLSGVAAFTLFGGITGNGSFSMQPAVTYSQTEEMEYLVSHVGAAAATYRVSAITGTPSEPVLFIGAQKLNGLGGWTQPTGETLPQAGGPRKIESSDSRVQKAVFRNGSIYYCQTVGLPAGRTAATIDRTAAQWVRLDSNADYVEGGRVEDPTATPTNGGKWYAYPSLSVNRFDDVLIGFTQFASNQHPAAGYATHVGGTTPASPVPVTSYKAGEGYYERLSPAGRNLWGFYSGAQVDPANDRDIWTIQEYAAAPVGAGPTSGRWGTWWARAVPLNRPPTVSMTSPADGSIYVEPATIQLRADASDVDGYVVRVEFFEGFRKIGDAELTLSGGGGDDVPPAGAYSLTWPNVPAGTYNIFARATDNEGQQTDSAPITVTVRPVSSLSDDFNDNSTDQWRWTVIGDRVFEQNGRLEITPPDNATGYPGYYGRQLFDLTNRRATVEAVQPAPLVYGIETYFELHDPSNNNHLLFATGGGGFILQSLTNGVVRRTLISYNPTAHRFWRFRHDPSDDSINFDMSPDGVAWTTYRNEPRPFNITKLMPILTCGKYTATTPAYTAIFDNYRVEDNPPSRVTFADDFNDNSMNASKWFVNANPGVAVVEQNQRLEVTPPASTTGYGGYYSKANHDLTESLATVELVQSTQQHYGIETYYMLADPNNGNYLLFATGGGNFLCQSVANGVMTRERLSYDPAQHRHLRFRHHWEDDTVAWETSADGVTWVTRRRIPRPFNITALRVQLLAGKYTATTPASTAVFDNFRMERPKPALPPSDNFNDNSLDPARWTQLDANSPVQVREQNQRLEIALAPSTAAYNGVMAVPSVDFRDKTVQVEVLQTVSFAGWAEQAFMLKRDDNNAFYFDVGGQGTFVCDAKTNGVLDRTKVWYDAVQYRFWRLRHNGAANTMNFEVSPNGQTWTTLKTVAVGFPLDSMKVWVYAGAWGTGNSAPGTAVYDNLRLTPNE